MEPKPFGGVDGHYRILSGKPLQLYSVAVSEKRDIGRPPHYDVRKSGRYRTCHVRVPFKGKEIPKADRNHLQYRVCPLLLYNSTNHEPHVAGRSDGAAHNLSWDREICGYRTVQAVGGGMGLCFRHLLLYRLYVSYIFGYLLSPLYGNNQKRLRKRSFLYEICADIGSGRYGGYDIRLYDNTRLSVSVLW